MTCSPHAYDDRDQRRASRKAKRRASREGTTLRAIVECALHRFLQKPTQKTGYRLVWRVERGRLQPGVKLEDRDLVFDLMQGRRR